MSRECFDQLQDYYLGIQRIYGDQDNFRVGPQTFEAICKLAQALAKFYLKETAEVEEANFTILLFNELILNSASYEVLLRVDQETSAAMLNNKKNTSQAKKFKKFIEQVKREVRAKESSIFTYSELKQIFLDLGFDSIEFITVIETLNEYGFFLQRNNQLFEFND